jgi:hypothetical protein
MDLYPYYTGCALFEEQLGGMRDPDMPEAKP